MKRTKLISLILAVIFILSPLSLADGVFYTPDEKDTVEAAINAFPQMSAESYIVVDAFTGEIIFEENSKTSMPIASITKMMTALVVVEKTEDLSRMVEVDAASCGIEGSSVNLYKGEKISVKDLLYALMLESANDAAVCLARAVSGSVETFASLMNEKAAELGMNNSHFMNPHGLEDPEHYSTAYDMALLWQEALKNEFLCELVATKSYKIPLDSGDGYRYLSNHNKLLKSYEPCVGGKTGFTKSAGRCLVTVCEKTGVKLITVTLNDPNDWEDHKNITDYAFSLYTKMRLADVGKITVDVPVVGGKKKSARLTNRDTLEISVRDVTRVESRVEAPRFLYAPVEDDGDAVGRVVFYYNGREIAELDLYSIDNVEINEVKPGFFKRIINWFTGK